MVRRSLIEICSWTRRLKISVSFWRGTRRVTSLIEVGVGFFDELENPSDLLDPDEVGGVLAVEVGEVEDHHVEGLPEFDARFV